MPGITVTQACKSFETSHYTVKAVDHADLSVGSGEAVAIVGPSGSGKSTLLNIIGLILKPDSGSVAVDGEEVLNMNDRRCSAFRNASFGYIVQDFALLDDETVYQNIRIPLLYNKQIRRRKHKPRIQEIAQKLDISDKLNRKAGKLSGGERQRVAIARAIVCDQPIILADEPTGSLDAANKTNVMDILMRLCKESGKTLIIVTHDTSIAERCDRIVQMADGRIEGDGKPAM
jgi:putative ABC transport system ATP-binding protein